METERIKWYEFFNKTEIENPVYQKVYEFENIDIEKMHDWLDVHGLNMAICLSLAYVILVHWGQWMMKDRPAFDLRPALIMWNCFLALVHIYGVQRSLPELFHALKTDGFYNSFCQINNHSVTTHFWATVFMWFKVVEFGDTLFIVLRKQKLIFLHWYHHITVCLFCFYCGGFVDPGGRYFGNINAVVHLVMYSYYAAKAARVKVPRSFSMCLTMVQILQMVVGLVINGISLVAKLSGYSCLRPYNTIISAFIIYASYFILFGKFFRDTYLRSTPPAKKID